jgi:hypothetical protein
MIVIAFAAYAGIGLLVGIAFIVRGIDRLDPVATGSSWGFRLLILPGAAALWPLITRYWWRARARAGSRP